MVITATASVYVSMTYSDYFVLEALKLLEPGQYHSYESISAHTLIPCSISTIQRSLKRLEQRNLIKRVGGRKTGYRFIVKEE